MMDCWRKWALRYLLGLALAPRVELLRGTVYHAIHEGIPESEIRGWGKEYAEVLDEARALYQARLEKGPPLPAAIAKEQTRRVPGVTMTSKPDQEEQAGLQDFDTDWRRENGETRARKEMGGLRDFKTTNWEGKHSSLEWAISGTLIGQLLATNNTLGVVDVINSKTGKTTIHEVRLTPAKASSLKGMIADRFNQVRERIRGMGKPRNATPVDEALPHNHNHCINKYGVCEFYGYCWGTSTDRLKYRRKPGTKDVMPPWGEELGLSLGEVTTARVRLEKATELVP